MAKIAKRSKCSSTDSCSIWIKRVTAPRESFHWIQSVKRTLCFTDRLPSRFRPYLSAGEDCSVVNACIHGTLKIRARGGPGVETEAAL